MAKATLKVVGGSETNLAGNISERHPRYNDILEDWILMRDCAIGERAVKRKGQDYLPMPSGFKGQKDSGTAMYNAYLDRAQFPEMLSPAILGMLGVMHRRDAEFEGIEGTQLEYMLEKATSDGMTLTELHRKISEELLTTGRVGLLADAPPAEAGGGEPYISIYVAESIINWSDEGDFFVLEEEKRIRDGFTWIYDTQYRVVMLDGDGYVAGVFSRDAINYADNDITRYSRLGGDSLVESPFIIAGSRDHATEPDQIPLINIARSAKAIYQLNADYRHQLFMTGQETLYFTGIDADSVPEYVGAGVAVALPEVGSTMGYATPAGTGIQAHRLAIQDEYETAAASGARVMDTTQRGAESGEALRMRARASTATLLTVALSSASALERALRVCASMKNMDPSSIVVKPNLDFLDQALSPTDAKILVDMWMSKAISYKTLYTNLQRAEIASQETSAEQEQKEMAEEGFIPTSDEIKTALDAIRFPEPDTTAEPAGSNGGGAGA